MEARSPKEILCEREYLINYINKIFDGFLLDSLFLFKLDSLHSLGGNVVLPSDPILLQCSSVFYAIIQAVK